MARIGKISEYERRQLLEEFLLGRNADLRTRLIEQYQDLVKKIARGFTSRTKEPLEDLIQVGTIGLINAIDRYEPNHGAQFETYATHLISGEIRHYLRDSSYLIRTPRELQEMAYQINLAIYDLSLELGSPPGIKEISKRLKLPLAKVEEFFQVYASASVISLNEPIYDEEGGETELISKIVDERDHSFQISLDDRIMIAEAMAKLEELFPTFAEIIRFSFYEDLSQIEIAGKLGLSQGDVSRKMKQGLKELWKILNRKVW